MSLAILLTILHCSCADAFVHGMATLPLAFWRGDDAIEDNSAADSGPLLFIGVNTAPGHTERRQEIRNSWMKWSFVQGPDPPVSVKFVVGASVDATEQRKLNEEMKLYGDFLEVPITENYHNLVNKTVSFLSWFAAKGDANYVMKLDDDTFPNLNLIVPMLQLKMQNSRTHTYAGAMLQNRKVLTWGRWAENADLYKEALYPPYAAGPAYLLGADLARLAFKDHLQDRLSMMLNNEDANVGVWIDIENKVTPVDYQNLDAEQEGCRPGVFFACNLEIGAMPCMWERKHRGEADICCNHELSNWEDRAQINSLYQKSPGKFSNTAEKEKRVQTGGFRFQGH